MATDVNTPLVNNNTKPASFDTFKKLGHSAGQALFALIALVITVVSATLLGVSKAITFFIPKDYSKPIDKFQSIISYLPCMAALYTAKFGCGVVGEFRDPAKQLATEKAVDQFFLNDKKQLKESILVAIDKFSFAHINGSNLPTAAN